MKSAFAAVAAALMASPSSDALAQPRAPVEFVGKPMLNGKPLPFSTAVRVGDMLYMSGQLGTRADNSLPDTFDGQARQVMENIGAVLKQSGLGWRNVVKCTVMLADMKDWPAFNAIYVTYFPDGRYPARSAFGANGLALGAKIELECQAYAGRAN